MKRGLLFALVLFGYGQAFSQVAGSTAGADHAVSFAAHVPLGVFARSHIAGAGLHYAWSHHRFGRITAPAKPVGLAFQAGADYYLGKKITTAGHDFRYNRYLYFHAAAGVLVNPFAHVNLSLTAGPTVGIYSGKADAGLGVNLYGSYFISEKIAIGPGVTYKKHAQADALWTGVVRVSYIF